MALTFPYPSRFEPVTVPTFSPTEYDPDLWLRGDQGISAGNGDPVSSWVSIEGDAHDFAQATSAKRPTFAASVNALNDKPAVMFDGVDDLLVKASGFLSGQQGTVFVACKLNDNTTIQTTIASADEASSVLFWTCRATVTVSLMQMCTSDGVTQNQINSDTTVSTERSIMMFASSGSSYELRLNGNAITEAVGSGSDDGMWLSDISGRDNTSIGGMKVGSNEIQFLKGYLAEVLVFPRHLSSWEVSQVESYLLTRYTPSTVPDMDSWWTPLSLPTSRKRRVREGLSEISFDEIIVAPTVPDLILVVGEIPQRRLRNRKHVQWENFYAVEIPPMGSWFEPASEPVVVLHHTMEWPTPAVFSPIIVAPTPTTLFVVVESHVSSTYSVLGHVR